MRNKQTKSAETKKKARKMMTRLVWKKLVARAEGEGPGRKERNGLTLSLNN